MAQKRKSFKVNDDLNVNKWGKIATYIMLFLVAEIFVCLILGWLSGDKGLNKISDNVVTSLLQNYNYLLGTVCLFPVIAYIYSKIKKKFNELYISESQVMMYGFFAVLIVLVVIISICALVYPINSSTWYGKNSYITVAIFLCPVVVLFLEAIVYGFLSIPELIKNKIFWKTFRKNLPIILLVLFLIWTFISCMLAPGAADDIIGAEKAKNVGATPSDVLAKTLNGCYNLKDGFWAFLMYGAIMLGSVMIGKDKVKEKKFLIKSFVIVMLLLSILTMAISAYGGYLAQKYEKQYESYQNNVESFDFSEELTKEDFDNYAKSEANIAYNNWYVYPQRSIFRNANHFAYVLCMAVMAAALLAITEKNIFEKLFYIFSYAVLMYMLIINDTFGGYLGVFASLICLIVYAIVSFIVDMTKKYDGDEEKKKHRKDALILLLIIIALCSIFTGETFGVKNENGTVIATSNINGFLKDFGAFSGYVVNEENATQAEVSTLDESVAKAGSGRGETWLKIWELVKQRPLFGYGLECLLFQFSGQFDVNEGRTHNLLLQLIGTVGIPGTIMYFLALAIIFIRLLKNWKTWDDIEKITIFVAIAYIVTAFTGNSSYYTSPYFMMFLGFVVLTPWKRENK